jgi:beta-glucanase (GH16 family)
MPNDENIDTPNPFADIVATNPITKDLVVSKEFNKHVHKSLKDGTNDCVKLNNTKRCTWSHAQRKANLGVDGKVSSGHVKCTQGASYTKK